MMRHTNEFEKKYLDNSRMSYVQCFKGTHLRRTEIACMVWVTQAFSGLSFTSFTAYFYRQVGFNSRVSFDLAVGIYGLAILGGIISWILYSFIGRRRLYIGGLFVLLTVLIIAGIVGSLPETNARSRALGSLLILLTFVYYMTIGPVCYVLIAEIPSTRLRVKTVVLARAAFNIATIVTHTITPRMLNPADWNWKGKSCFLYAGTTILCLVWCYLRLPETSGLGYLEIDILFERHAKARKFRELRANLENTGYFDLPISEQRSSIGQGY